MKVKGKEENEHKIRKIVRKVKSWRNRLPNEEHAAADSSIKIAILTNRNGSTIPSTSTTGNTVRADIRRPEPAATAVVFADPFPSLFDIVTLFIPLVDM